jgi:hypothetical protein
MVKWKTQIDRCTLCGTPFEQPVFAPHGHGFCSMKCMEDFWASERGICCKDYVYYILNELEW